MKKSKTKDLFVKGTRICLGLILFGISSFWGYKACLKVKTPPVGTRLQYRYGDDFKGNVEIMALTVCPDALWFYKFIEGTKYGQGHLNKSKEAKLTNTTALKVVP